MVPAGGDFRLPTSEACMSKPFPDISSGAGLEGAVTLPAPVVEQIELEGGGAHLRGLTAPASFKAR